jgi:hypothetical protein
VGSLTSYNPKASTACYRDSFTFMAKETLQNSIMEKKYGKDGMEEEKGK